MDKAELEQLEQAFEGAHGLVLIHPDHVLGPYTGHIQHCIFPNLGVYIENLTIATEIAKSKALPILYETSFTYPDKLPSRLTSEWSEVQTRYYPEFILELLGQGREIPSSEINAVVGGIYHSACVAMFAQSVFSNVVGLPDQYAKPHSKSVVLGNEARIVKSLCRWSRKATPEEIKTHSTYHPIERLFLGALK
ncbi:hypothetical protein HOC35_00955 [Candidatus Woesearchaeota archaeon]|jgi:hypothetical protein|nr:hypothetical protein [Candidatus Woesearchaeota archaeon]